jgi:hypothetical protein
MVRVPHGQPRPSAETFVQALERDRAALRLPPSNTRVDFAVAGPYHVSVGGKDLDEYVVWER